MCDNVIRIGDDIDGYCKQCYPKRGSIKPVEMVVIRERDVLNLEIKEIINSTTSRHVVVNRLKKLLLPKEYKVTIEEEYIIQFKGKELLDAHTINIDLEPYMT